MRAWLRNLLLTDPEISSLVGDRVIAGGGLSSSLTVKPYLVLIVGNSTAVNLSEDDDDPSNQFFQIYVHDEVGDYTRIDDIVNLVIDRLRGQSSTQARVIQVRYLETSRDLDDETLNTFLRYIRFQAVRSI